MAAMSGVLVLTLPETNNQKLPDSLKEAQEQDHKKSEDNGERETNKDGETERKETKTTLWETIVKTERLVVIVYLWLVLF